MTADHQNAITAIIWTVMDKGADASDIQDVVDQAIKTHEPVTT